MKRVKASRILIAITTELHVVLFAIAITDSGTLKMAVLAKVIAWLVGHDGWGGEGQKPIHR